MSGAQLIENYFKCRENAHTEIIRNDKIGPQSF